MVFFRFILNIPVCDRFIPLEVGDASVALKPQACSPRIRANPDAED